MKGLPPDRRDFLRLAGKLGSLTLLPRSAMAMAFDTMPPPEQMKEALRHDLLPSHPRLHLRKEQWLELREAIPHNDFLLQTYNQLQSTARRMLTEPVAEYKLLGPRLLYQSRAALRRIQTLAALFRLDGDTRKADRARSELKAICNFPSWHPAHFLDVAEMTNAAALGYDWLYDVISVEERRMLRTKIMEFGLKPGLAQYESGVSWSLPFANNWGQVCAGGLTMGALAIAGDETGEDGDKPAAVLTWTVSKVRNAMQNYAPDGGWPEGPGYWLYATRYTCAMISALNSALGRDFGLSNLPGFADTGNFRMASIGPTGKPFNYADSPPGLEPAPEMFWLAKRFAKPEYIANERSLLSRSRPNIFHLLWGNTGSIRSTKALPLDQQYSRIDVAFLRSSWTDPNAFFVAFKGGDNKASHAHLDLGTFVLDALGERWALDLGPDDYDLPGYFGEQRWNYCRLRSEGHNIITLGTSNQGLTAKSPMHSFRSTEAAGQAIVDLSSAYVPALKHVEREVRLEREPRSRVVITDRIKSDAGQPVRWNMHTSAHVTVSANQAILAIGSKQLRLAIESPVGAKFDVISAQAPSPQGKQDEVVNLTINLKLTCAATEIVVTFEAS